jgi:shikimate dehydrogenase
MKPVYDLRDLENWETATRGTFPPVRLGVLGDPVAHSFSPQMQNAALKASGIEMQYARFKISPNELRRALERMRELRFVGCNLTVPHKTTASRLVDEFKERAHEIGAINTIAFCDQKLLGWNTDCLGFSRGLLESFEIAASSWRILILGAGGGAGRAIAWQCALEHCPRLVLVNRDLKKARAFAHELAGYFASVRNPADWLRVVPWEKRALRREFREIDLVVNATPLRTIDSLPMSRDLYQALHVYDLNYQAKPSPLLRVAESMGARGANGLTMLLHQGALAFEHWFNQSAPLEAMRTALQT